jgi:Flp pilus assembly protein TadG
MTVRFVARLVRCFVGSTRAVAAIEFAVVLPMLAVVFMGCFDGGRAVVAYMKVRAATYVLASITNQYATIASSDMTDILGAASVVMAPYNSGTPKVTVSQIKISGTGTATIGWSAAQGATARSVGSSISPPAAIKVNGSYLVFAEISYTYAPLFGLFGSGGITFSDNLYVTPRHASCIVYTPQSSTC